MKQRTPVTRIICLILVGVMLVGLLPALLLLGSRG